MQATVLPEMRTRQSATELGVVLKFYPAEKKHGLGANLFFFFFFFFFFFSLVPPICSVRNRTVVVT